MRLQDKVILVSGSTTGIGEAIARRVVAEGGRVLIHGRDHEKGEQVRASLGDAAASHYDDLTDPEAPQRIVSAAVEAFGKVDALVNNAAVVNRSNLDTSAVGTRHSTRGAGNAQEGFPRMASRGFDCGDIGRSRRDPWGLHGPERVYRNNDRSCPNRDVEVRHRRP